MAQDKSPFAEGETQRKTDVVLTEKALPVTSRGETRCFFYNSVS